MEETVNRLVGEGAISVNTARLIRRYAEVRNLPTERQAVGELICTGLEIAGKMLGNMPRFSEPAEPLEPTNVGCFYASPFALGDRVHIDGNEDLVARVTAVSWREENPQIECSWWNERALTTAWISPSRLSLVPPR